MLKNSILFMLLAIFIVFGCSEHKKHSINFQKKVSYYKAGKYLSTSVSVDDDILVVGTGEGNVKALNSENGETKWVFKTIGKSNDKEINISTNIHSTPLIVDDIVIAGVTAGYIYGININDGKLKWMKKLDESIYGDITNDDDTVFIPTASHLYAIKSYDGSEVWKHSLSDKLAGTPKVQDDVIFFTTQNGLVSALRTSDGNAAWHVSKLSDLKCSLITKKEEEHPNKTVSYFKISAYNHTPSVQQFSCEIKCGDKVFVKKDKIAFRSLDDTVEIGSLDEDFNNELFNQCKGTPMKVELKKGRTDENGNIEYDKFFIEVEKK